MKLKREPTNQEAELAERAVEAMVDPATPFWQKAALAVMFAAGCAWFISPDPLPIIVDDLAAVGVPVLLARLNRRRIVRTSSYERG